MDALERGWQYGFGTRVRRRPPPPPAEGGDVKRPRTSWFEPIRLIGRFIAAGRPRLRRQRDRAS